MNVVDAQTLQCVLDGRPKPAEIADEQDLAGLLHAKGHGHGMYRPQHVDTAVSNLHRLHAVAGLCRDLEATQAEPILLPGASLLRLYPDLGCRPMEDVDLLVRPGHRQLVVDALDRRGWHASERHPNVFSHADGSVIDLHTDLLNGDRLKNRWRAGWIEPADAFARCVRRTVAGFHLLTLSDEDELLVTAAHSLRHSYRRLIWLIDFALQLRVLTKDGQALWDLSQGTRLYLQLRYSLELVDESGVSLPSWVSSCSGRQPLPKSEAFILRWIHRHRHQTVAGELLSCWSCSNRVDRLRFLIEFVFPRPDVLLQVYPRLPSWLAPLAYPMRLLQIVGRGVSELTFAARRR